MGTPKQLLPIAGKPLIIHLLEEVLQTDFQVAVIVVGVYSKEIKKTVKDYSIDVIENPNWQLGIGTSISCGVKYLLKKVSNLHTISVLTTDQYFVNSLHLMNLTEQFDRFYKEGKTIVATLFSDCAFRMIFLAPISSFR